MFLQTDVPCPLAPIPQVNVEVQWVRGVVGACDRGLDPNGTVREGFPEEGAGKERSEWLVNANWANSGKRGVVVDGEDSECAQAGESSGYRRT